MLEAQSESPAAQDALERLCRVYWRPIYSFVQRQGIGPEEAKDITQSFFADLLEHRSLTAVRKEKGRFRSYLLGALKYFLADERRRAMAIKRGKGQQLIPLDELTADERIEVEAADPVTAEQIYERRWASTVLARVLDLLKNEYGAAGNAGLFNSLKQLLPDEPGAPSQANVAAQLGMTENAIRQAFYRFRQRYQSLLREEISHTVSTPGDVEDELRHLIAVVSGVRCNVPPDMPTVIRVCRKCGAKIFSDAPEGLCTGCVLETALDIFPDTVAGVADPGRADDFPGDKANALPRAKMAERVAKMLGELGDYELLEEVGRGGQGVVFRARQKSLNRIVALKVIGLGQWATKAHLRRFRLEAEAAASLDHPCIVPIYEVGERDGQCYFSMKFVEGGQLDEVVKRTPISIREAVELIAKVARTVHYAHEHGILHRDIKPGNILLGAKGEPHLTDFGLARLVESESTVTRTLEVLGTPSYMAPEQAAGNNIQLTSATDVYGLGAVLYQLLTSHPPFAGGTIYETIKLLLGTEPRPPRLWNPKVDRDLSTICLKCLEKNPQRRYSSALALAEDLERWLKHEPIRARRTGVVARGKKWLQRNPTVAAVIALSIALMTSLGVIVWKSDLFRRPAATGIAVLPFKNLSNDREDASFADGVQDDLLTKLAKIADLKVISRTSVMGYRGKQNTREIGNALEISHVLEGSVRKTGAWLHINVQLIDAHTDSHVWAEEYDRDLKDMFAIQSEIAQKVAGLLHAKISTSERLAIERSPTVDLTAFDLYSRAKNLVLAWSYDATEKGNLLQAADLLNQAVAHDPTFFQAYCQLAWVHDELYQFRFDRTPARLALGEAAIDSAFHLRPDAGEAHVARAGTSLSRIPRL